MIPFFSVGPRDTTQRMSKQLFAVLCAWLTMGCGMFGGVRVESVATSALALSCATFIFFIFFF